VLTRAARPGSRDLENYFNYFTEIEECFRKCRGTATLLSPLDWALIESWKEASIPLQAVLTGVERAFEKFARRPRPFQKINSLAYCTQTVMQAVEDLKTAQLEGGDVARASGKADGAPFSTEEVEAYLSRNAEILEEASRYWLEKGQEAVAHDLEEAAAALRRLAERDSSLRYRSAQNDMAGGSAPDGGDAGVVESLSLQDLENHLSALEDKLTASVTRAAPVELLAQIRQEAERGLVRCRQEMTAAQLESVERQFQKKRLYEHYGIPRLSLFYFCP